MTSPIAEQLTPFEALMWLDDRPGYPMVFYFRLSFSGSIDPSLLREAARRALDRHPRLSSRVVASGVTPKWQRAETSPQLHVMATPSDFPPGYWQGIDLAEATGLRLLILPQESQSEFLAQFHHACCDGVGALNFLGDLLGYYHALQGHELPAALARPLTPGATTRRGDLELNQTPTIQAPPPPAPPPASASVAAQAREYLLFRPARIASAKPPSAPAVRDANASGGNLVSAWIPPTTAQALRQTARDLSVTLNDLLLRDFFLELDQWNAAHGKWLAPRRLRILMPINMRTAAQRRAPAANLMSYCFLQRRPEELKDADKLLEGIAWETREIRRQGFGGIFLGALEWLMGAPRIFRLVLRIPACFATAVVSNLGDPVRRIDIRLPLRHGRITAGNLVLDSIVAAPPIRPGTAFAIAFTTYAESIGMMAMYCSKTLSSVAAQELLDSYIRRLHRTAELSPADSKAAPSGAPADRLKMIETS